MKASELRIGNWVLFLGKEKQILGMSKCNYEMKTETTSYYAEFKNHIPVMFSHLKPIPLTEEWLLKFGFDANPYHDRYELNSIYIDCDKTKGRLDLWESKTGVTISYVHQLQNLYFALTGEELEVK